MTLKKLLREKKIEKTVPQSLVKDEICHKMSFYLSSESKYQALQTHLKFKKILRKELVAWAKGLRICRQPEALV